MPTQETSPDADAQLILQICSGNQQAFLELYDRFSRPLYSLAQRILENPQDSEDVIQQSFVQVWKKAASFQTGRASLFTWLVLITRAKAIDRLRQRQRQTRLSQEQACHAEADPDAALAGTALPGTAQEQLIAQEQRAAILAALDKIPADQREAIELAFFTGLTQTEISETLATPLGTIKARIRRGMLRLRDCLEGRL